MQKVGSNLIDKFWFRLFIIILFSLPIYSMYFNMFFDAEDFELLMYRPFSDLITWYKGGNFFHYIPLPMTLYTIEYHIFPDNPIPYRMVNYILHVCCALLIYNIISYTAKKEVAFLASVLFAILPVHLETVVALNHRQDLFYTLFSLLSLLFFIRYIRDESRIIYIILSFVFFIFGIFSKESTIMLPFLLLTYNLFFDDKRDIKILFKRHFSFFLLGGIYILYRIYLFGSLGSYGHEGIGPSPYTFEKYIFTNYNWYFHQLTQPFPVITFFIILLAFFHRYIFSSNVFPFAICWIVLSLLPVYPFQGERFLYLASFGYVYFIADFIVTLLTGYDMTKVSSSKSIDFIKSFLILSSFLFMGYFGIQKSIKNLLPHDHRLLPIFLILLIGSIYLYKRVTKGQKLVDFMMMGKRAQTFIAVAFLIIFIISSITTLWFKDYISIASSQNYKNIYDCIKNTCKDDLASSTEIYLDFHGLQQSLHTLTLPPVYFIKHTQKQNYYYRDYYENRKKFGPVKDNNAYFFDVENWNCSPRNDITNLIRRRGKIEKMNRAIETIEIPSKSIKKIRDHDYIYYEVSVEWEPLNIERINVVLDKGIVTPDLNLTIEWIAENSPRYDTQKSLSFALDKTVKIDENDYNLSLDVGNSLYFNIYGQIKGFRLKILANNQIQILKITYSIFSTEIKD
ncbi:glycosyltransferase family 39 protein [bacterium]|nr:glycosyltransferase family 39 protein [bacterium]